MELGTTAREKTHEHHHSLGNEIRTGTCRIGGAKKYLTDRNLTQVVAGFERLAKEKKS